MGPRTIRYADLIISTATFPWPDEITSKFVFRRHVFDESHLLGGNNSAKVACAKKVHAQCRWCVSATPMVSSASDLHHQNSFFGMPTRKERSLVSTEEEFQSCMIRHVKSQIIGGCSALTLPPSTTSIHMITLSLAERKKYDGIIQARRPTLCNLCTRPSIPFLNLQKELMYPVQNALMSATSSKIQALRTALTTLLRADPQVRAVVFTQLREMQGLIKGMVGTSLPGMRFYSFDGASHASARDKAIREFQSGTGGSALFCVTLQTGSVGITLTAASHIFLCEPCFNPVQEIQAAGRIHRMGQTKEVQVTKLIYKDTYEENVVAVHQQVESGQLSFTPDGGIPQAGVKRLLQGICPL